MWSGMKLQYQYLRVLNDHQYLVDCLYHIFIWYKISDLIQFSSEKREKKIKFIHFKKKKEK